MYSEDDLNSAVAAGAIGAEAAEGLRDFVARRRAAPAADEESFRLVTGFNDIFVAIAAVLLLSALGWLGARIESVLGGASVAAASWLFAEYFTRRRRMALPSIVLLCAFVGGVYAAGVALVVRYNVDAMSFWGMIRDMDTAGRLVGLEFAACGAVAALAAYAHWRRFMVPITVAAGAAAAVAMALALALTLAPGLRGHVLPLVFLAGIALFALALRWDASDRERRTRRSDVAFWLHLTAAPLIVHPAFSMLATRDATVGHAMAAVAIYLGLALVALAVDRRALLVSALIYLLYAMKTLFEAVGSAGESFAVTALVIGSVLLLLSALWHHVRRLVVAVLPKGVRSRLPATEIRAVTSPGVSV